jgi:hypothetical protein
LRRWQWLLPAIVLVSAPLSSPAPGAAQDSTLERLLRDVGAYVDQYERDVSAVVAEEQYLQIAQGRGMVSRRLRSDVLVMDADENGWVAFRDVFEVDGRPVRDRDERLARLFLEPHPNPAAQLKHIVDESARFNLNPISVAVNRTINTPMTALLFFRSANQARSSFEHGGEERIEGRHCIRVSFVEQQRPRLIATDNDQPARGSACIEPETGRVLQTDLRLRSTWVAPPPRSSEREIAARITVVYRDVPRLSLWLPATMDEFYDVRPGSDVLQGRAEYSAFRRFEVATEAAIK